MRYIVSQEWLKEHLYEPNIRIVDCRFSLADQEEGQQLYDTSHIVNAVYCDLEKDLSAPVSKHGGRHPLPDKEAIVRQFSRLGVSKDTKVVIYDDQGGAMASRLWFMLQYAGHKEAFILDGGFSKWKDASYPITNETPKIVESTFICDFKDDLLVSMEDVKAAITDRDTILIDSREEKRYKGIYEPIDPIAGHIPTALNYFWKNLLTENQQWKDKQALLNHFIDLPKDKQYIVYCGSGVSACPNVLALLEAGFENVKLYSGSFSDWCSYEENEIIKNEK